MPFQHAYNFVPLPVPGAVPHELRAGPPAGHHRWQDDLWSGEIAVTMTAVTPLLIMENDGDAPADEHRTLSVSGADRVDLAPSEIKGMLRSAFEAVTGSRMGVFGPHEARLGHRAAADGSAAGLTPALVRPDGRVELLQPIAGGGGRGSAAVLVEAWLAGRYLLPSQLAHGDLVEADITYDNERRGWVASAVTAAGAGPLTGTMRVQGQLHVTGPTAGSKKHERIFVTAVSDDLTQDDRRLLDPDPSALLVDELTTLIAHQRAIHVTAAGNEIGADHPPWEYHGHEPGQTAWSRHLYDVAGAGAPHWVGPNTVLPPPQGRVVTCFAEGTSRLRPVTVSRLLHTDPPAALLDPALHPAAELAALSPADRVFGWVRHGKRDSADAAYRGQLRVVALGNPARAQAVQVLDPQLTIPPLATPKPEQSRFYLRPTRANGNGPERGDLYRRDWQTLRGRKFYPHHRDLEGRSTEELCRSLRYRPPAGRELRDGQNTTLAEWVRPGAEFRFVLRVADLRPLELGALLWLLDPARAGLPDAPARHRIGRGKPLGFGAVELRVDAAATRLHTGRSMRLRLLNFDAEPAGGDWSGLAARFEEAALGSGLGEVVRALRTLLGGVTGSVSYPRMKTVGAVPPRPVYEWFVQNEKPGNRRWLPEPGERLREGEPT